MHRFVLAVFLAAAPGYCLAQANVPEKLLPAGSQLYYRFDGVKNHRTAFNKTACGKIMNGETGKFLHELGKYLSSQTRHIINLQGGGNQELVDAVGHELTGFIHSLANNGIVAGVELENIQPFELQAVLVFPDGAGKKQSPLSFFNLLAKVIPNLQVREVTTQGRKIKHLQMPPAHVAWWAEGKDAVLALGSDEPAAFLKRLRKTGGLTANPHFKEVQTFKEFPIWSRGYLDLPALGKAVAGQNPQIAELSKSLGLNDIRSLTFFSGFDGPAQRSVYLLNLNKGPRTGIFKLANNKTFTLKDLPPMPPGVTAFSASNFNTSATYDFGVRFADMVVKMADPQGNINVRKTIEDFEKKNNFRIRDVFEALDEMMVQYYDANEGMFGMGQVVLVKVKDEKKLNESLGRIIQAANNQFGTVNLKKSNYRRALLQGLEIVDPTTGTTITMAYWTIHKGWFAYSSTPVALKGLILRLDGRLESWQADAKIRRALGRFPKEFTGISVSDPRPTVKTIYAAMPFATYFLNGFMQGMMQAVAPGARVEPFDATLIPNTYEATQHLFPNVTVMTDEGKRLRTETRASLMLPF